MKAEIIRVPEADDGRLELIVSAETELESIAIDSWVKNYRPNPKGPPGSRLFIISTPKTTSPRNQH